MDIIHFAGSGEFELRQVGGKGFSLIKMTRAGFTVPPGFVLSPAFFTPWLESLQQTRQWKEFTACQDGGRFASLLEPVRDYCSRLELTPGQREELDAALAKLGVADADIFAVRSSSPEEDLASASFAGMYETVLGVTVDKIEKAIRTVFLSAVDIRVVRYKQAHGFDPYTILIAVVVQRQIPSEAAGVGFSVNPLNNCYDEVVVNANWGLGESIVSGQVTPDQFVIDKVRNKIIKKDLGGKELSLFLQGDGNVEQRRDARHDVFALTDGQALELGALIEKVEKYYGLPMDIEWAFYKGALYLLQARPITTSLPLHPVFQTKPGEPRAAYLDLTLVEQGIQKPLSPLGCEFFGDITDVMFQRMTGKHLGNDAKTGLGASAGGRTYLNLSNMLTLMSKKSVAGQFRSLDTSAAESIEHLDEKIYKPAHKPAPLKGIMFSGLYRSAGMIGSSLEGLISPERLDKKYKKGVAEFVAALDELDAADLSLREYYGKMVALIADLMFHITIPTLVDAETAKGSLTKMFAAEDEEIRNLADKLDRALPHNVTTEMGLKLYQLSQFCRPEDIVSADEFARRINSRDLPQDFLQAWDGFISEFGFRGPGEIDLANPRYAEEPSLVYEHIRNMAGLPSTTINPQAQFEENREARVKANQALDEFTHEKGMIKHKLYQRLYQVVEAFGGYRESHKYYLVMASVRLRRRLLEAGRLLQQAGQIDEVNDVFSLQLADIERGLADPQAELRSIIAANQAYMEKTKNIASFPAVIDSRGAILRPPRRKARPGELIGDSISAGKVKGPVKIMHSPSEKKVEPGDILVIHSADPSWTPLFVTAGGVLLEVGGLLQHGSIIAREYGKPCIVGIEGLLDKVKDGEIIEMNGAEGIVKLPEALAG